MRKPGLTISFWAIYMLAFTVGLPIIIYYAGGYASETPPAPTNLTYISIGLALAAWLLIFIFYGRFYVKSVFTDKQAILKAADEGSTIIAKITNKVQEGMMRNIAVFRLRLAFTNFSGTPVEVNYQLMDSKPEEKRYEKGDILELSVNLKKKGGQIVPKGFKVVPNPTMVFLYTFIFLVLIGTAVYFPLTEDWRNFVLPHPWTLIPLINVGTAIFIGLLLKWILNMSSANASVRMIVYGLKVTGNIVSYQQTGTFINEQPQVAFNVEFTDKEGRQHSIVTKKIVSLLDIHKLGTGPVDIMYLPEDPGKMVFSDDLSL